MKIETYFGVYRGVVVDIEDPLKLGRCRIKVPDVHGILSPSDYPLLPWARYVSPLPTGNNKGMFILPQLNDIVWVMFEGGNKKYPIYIGSTYGIVDNKNETPIDDGETPDTTEVLYRSKLNKDDTIQATIKKTKNYFEFSYGDASIKISKDGKIKIHANNDIHIESESNTSITSDKGTVINANNKVSIESNDDVSIASDKGTSIKSGGDVITEANRIINILTDEE